MFEIATLDNTQHITLNDNAGEAPLDCWLIGTYRRSIPYAVLCYAKKYGIPADRVGYSVRPARVGEV